MDWAKVKDAVMRRPLVLAVTFLILGIGGHRVISVSPAIVIGISAGMLLVSFLIRRWGAVADLLLACALVGCGAAGGRLEDFYYSPEHIANFTKDERRLARLEIEVITAPRVIGTGNSDRPLPPRQVMQAQVSRILTVDGWKTGTGLVLVQLQQPRNDLEIRQKLEVLGMLERPAPAMNPGQFDWAEYYREQRILTSIDVPHGANISILSSPGPSILDRLRAGARRALEAGFSKEHAVDHALLRALVLGDSDPMLRDVQDEFIRTGTSHHLAISGMHIAVLAGLVYFFCRLLMVSPKKSAWIGMGFVLLYGAVALPSPPVVRSILFCMLFGIGLVSRRSLDGVQLVALSGFLMLIYHPLDLYNAGFQLSFGTTLGLMLFAPALLKGILTAMRDPDMEVAFRARKPSRWQMWKRNRQHQIAEIGGTSGIAAVVAAPLTAFHFNQFNLWGIPATIILMIPVFLSLVAGLLKIVLSLLLPPLAPLLATIAAWPVMLMRGCVDWLARWPGNDIPLVTPSIWLVLAYYMLLLAFLLPVEKGRARRWMNRTVTAALALIIALPLLIAPTANAPDGDAKLTLLSVGAGQCAVMQLPGGKIMLFDAGSQTPDLWRRCVAPFLKIQALSRIDSVYISHANYDHFSAAADAARLAGVRHVMIGPNFTSQARMHLAGRHLLQSLHDPPLVISAGKKIELDKQTNLEVLWPPEPTLLQDNDASLVLKVTTRGRTILFTGDIQDAAMRGLLAHPELLKCDVLVAPHHGSSELTTLEFVKATEAKIILSSNDNTLTQKQRTFEKLVAETPLYRTNRCGAITISIDKVGPIRTKTFLVPRP